MLYPSNHIATQASWKQVPQSSSGRISFRNSFWIAWLSQRLRFLFLSIAFVASKMYLFIWLSLYPDFLCCCSAEVLPACFFWFINHWRYYSTFVCSQTWQLQSNWSSKSVLHSIRLTWGNRLWFLWLCLCFLEGVTEEFPPCSLSSLFVSLACSSCCTNPWARSTGSVQ